jgi:hypothetical protein
VQSQANGQVAVDLTGTTTYTQTTATTLSAVTVGACVVATSAATSAGGSPTAAPSDITAGTVTVTAAVNGRCTRGGFGGFGGVGGVGGTRPTDLPSNRPTGFPSGRPGGAARGLGAVVAGTVTAVHGSTLTVQAEHRAQGSTSATTSPVTVHVGPATRFERTGPATRAAVKVGLCLTAFGSAGSDGTVTATRVSLAPVANGSCETGLRRLGAGGGGTAAGGGTGGTGG